MPDKVKSKLEEAGYKVTSEDEVGLRLPYVKVDDNKKVIVAISTDPAHVKHLWETYDYYAGHWYVEDYGHFRDHNLDAVIKLNAKFLEGET